MTTVTSVSDRDRLDFIQEYAEQVYFHGRGDAKWHVFGAGFPEQNDGSLRAAIDKAIMTLRRRRAGGDHGR